MTLTTRRDPRRLPPMCAPLSNYVVVDTETTGLSIEDGARLLEIGAVRVRGDRLAGTYTRLVNPHRTIPPRISELTGITGRMVRNQMDVQEAMAEFTGWLEPGDIIIAHNAGFDYRFLDMACRETFGEEQWFFPHMFLDSLELSRLVHPEQPRHSVARLIRRYGIGRMERHRALSDALQEQKLYECLRREAFGI